MLKSHRTGRYKTQVGQSTYAENLKALPGLGWSLLWVLLGEDREAEFWKLTGEAKCFLVDAEIMKVNQEALISLSKLSNKYLLATYFVLLTEDRINQEYFSLSCFKASIRC